MFRMSGAIYKDGRLLRDCVSRQEDPAVSRTGHVLTALNEICAYLDLAVPIWLDPNIREFQRKSRTQFDKDCFMEEIPFDYLKIEVIEE
jgi:hypothetical protein